MLILKGTYVKHVALIVCLLLQVIAFKTVQGINCIQCGVEGVDECKGDLTTFKTCKGDSFKKCFTQIDKSSGKIMRGCLKDDMKCTTETNCVSSEDGKNNQQICKTCSAADTDCSQTTALASKYSQICDAGISKCITKLDAKLVVRGCVSDADASKCTDKNVCATCAGVNCNTDVMPPNRLSCYQCSGASCNDVTTNSTISKECSVYEEKDECYTKGESEATMTRGCKSDTNENKCSAPAEGCAFCSENGCNKLKYKGPSTLKCYQCEGDAQNSSCYQNQTETSLKTCQKEVLYNQAQYCYTQVQGGKIKRGCLNDNPDLTADKCTDAEGGACYKCVDAACNGKYSEFTCIRCRSDEKTDCWNDATKLKGETCNVASTPTDGCFHGVWNGVAIRGCTLDASPQDQALCKDAKNPNKCEICHSKDCNTLPSSATKNGMSFAVMAVVLTGLTLWNFK